MSSPLFEGAPAFLGADDLPAAFAATAPAVRRDERDHDRRGDHGGGGGLGHDGDAERGGDGGVDDAAADRGDSDLAGHQPTWPPPG